MEKQPCRNARRHDVGGEVFRRHEREIAQVRADEGRVAFLVGIDVVEAGKLGGTVGREVVGHDAAGIGPADQHRALQARGIHHGLDLVAPVFRGLVALGLERLVGIAVAAQVVGHHVEFLGEIAAGDLLDPRQMTL